MGTEDMDVTAVRGAALHTQITLDAIEEAVKEERKKVAAYLEMAYGCGEPTCRSCIGKMLADAILEGEHDHR